MDKEEKAKKSNLQNRIDLEKKKEEEEKREEQNQRIQAEKLENAQKKEHMAAEKGKEREGAEKLHERIQKAKEILSGEREFLKVTRGKFEALGKGTDGSKVEARDDQDVNSTKVALTLSNIRLDNLMEHKDERLQELEKALSETVRPSEGLKTSREFTLLHEFEAESDQIAKVRACYSFITSLMRILSPLLTL